MPRPAPEVHLDGLDELGRMMEILTHASRLPEVARRGKLPTAVASTRLFGVELITYGFGMLDDEGKRQLLQSHWERHANESDFDAAHAIYHEDAILEWPQSGERFVGKETLRAMREGAPPLKFTTWRVTGGGDVWTVENLMSVAGGVPQLTINVLIFRGDKVAHEIVYITQRFEAAPERAPFAQRFEVPSG